jgi:hypothetical protein
MESAENSLAAPAAGSSTTLNSKKHWNSLKSDIKIEMAMGLAKTAVDRTPGEDGLINSACA